MLFKRTLEAVFFEEHSKFMATPTEMHRMFGGDTTLLANLEQTYQDIQIEQQKIHTQKALMSADDKIRSEVKRQL